MLGTTVRTPLDSACTAAWTPGRKATVRIKWQMYPWSRRHCLDLMWSLHVCSVVSQYDSAWHPDQHELHETSGHVLLQKLPPSPRLVCNRPSAKKQRCAQPFRDLYSLSLTTALITLPGHKKWRFQK